jgi:hypothetical protein
MCWRRLWLQHVSSDKVGICEFALVSTVLLSGLASLLKGGSISGVAQYLPGEALSGAFVHLRNGVGDVETSKTATDGSFRFAGLADGEYSLNIQASGFAQLHVERIMVNADSDVRLAPLIPQLGSCAHQHTVQTNFLRPIDSTAIARITGIVTVEGKGRNNPPVSGAEVILHCDDRAVCGSVRSGRNGIFTIDVPPVEKLHVQIQRPGFYTSEIEIIFPQKGWQNNYGAFRLDRCPLGNCTPLFRPRPPISICE